MKSVNAIIKSYKFCTSDWNCFTFGLELDMGGQGCMALGSINLGSLDPYTNYCQDKNYMAYFFSKIFEVCDITELNDIVGKPVRAIFKKDGRLGDTCIGIQHFLKDGIFFIPSLKEDDRLIDIVDILKSSLDIDVYNKYTSQCNVIQNIGKVRKNNNN